MNKNRENNRFTLSVRLIIEVGILLFATGIAWATLNGNVSRNSNEIVGLKKKANAYEEAVFEIKADIRVICIEQGHINTAISKIEEKIKGE